MQGEEERGHFDDRNEVSLSSADNREVQIHVQMIEASCRPKPGQRS